VGGRPAVSGPGAGEEQRTRQVILKHRREVNAPFTEPPTIVSSAGSRMPIASAAFASNRINLVGDT
jgi:hypothetical protein